MPANPNPVRASDSAASRELDATVAELYPKSGAEALGMARRDLQQILQEIVRKYLPPSCSTQEAHEFCCALRIDELVLARACAAGNNKAWEVFLTRFREKLFDIATYITKESSAGRDLADSIYADLYGTSTREAQRVSKLNSYTGRGSLEGWLRTVMAQEHVNRFRRQKRLISLDEEAEEGVQFATPEPEQHAAVDTRLEQATDEALASLSPEDRFVLAAYFLDDRTLADVARTLGVHESTISRKLDKLAKLLRKQILVSLSHRGMNRRQAQEAMEIDIRDLRVNVRKRLAQENAPPAFSKKKAEAPAGDGSG
jgi:RNA polymerase sigma-70 factor (ECF subfamily)